MKDRHEYESSSPAFLERQGGEPLDRRALNEGELVELIKADDNDACSEAYRRYEPRLFRTAVRILRNKEDSEDVVQEALSKAFRKIDKFKGDSA